MLDTIYDVTINVTEDIAVIKKPIKFKEADLNTCKIKFILLEKGDVVTFAEDDTFELETISEEAGSVKFVVPASAFVIADDKKSTIVTLPEEVVNKIGKHKCILVVKNGDKTKHLKMFEIEIEDLFSHEE